MQVRKNLHSDIFYVFHDILPEIIIGGVLSKLSVTLYEDECELV